MLDVLLTMLALHTEYITIISVESSTPRVSPSLKHRRQARSVEARPLALHPPIFVNVREEVAAANII